MSRDFPQEVVLISRDHRSLHRGILSEPGVLKSVAPPACGTCHAYQAGYCRQNRTKVTAVEMGCTSHNWQRGWARLQELLDDLRRQPGRGYFVRALAHEFGQAEASDLSYLASIEDGSRPAVGLKSTDTIPAQVTVNMHGQGGMMRVDWVRAEAERMPDTIANTKPVVVVEAK